MTAEQLQAARAAHWRQKQNPILTLEDAQTWLEQHPLCLYLPRRAQLPAPAPSFVEACMGSAQATPHPEALEQAQQLLNRLVISGTVVALNLLGAVGEQPDFLAHRDALPFILCLRADQDWKHAPQKSSGHKVSPLVLELWKALDSAGTLTAAAARETLGRELTEAAVLRALCELWQSLRISPVAADHGREARWELLRVQHRDALASAAATGQVTALSLLVSMYLQSVYAASSEEIEIFLSPMASRSRVREAVRGLSATRQIQSLSMEAQTYYFLENGLPEFAAPAVPPVSRDKQPARAAKKEPTWRRLPARSNAPAPVAPQPAKAEWKTPPRPAAQGRPSWQGAGKPPAGPRPWLRGERGPRPPLSPGRSFSPPDGRRAAKIAEEPGKGAAAPRSGARPDTRAAERNSGAWKRTPGREKPKPWGGRGTGPRPPQAGGRGDSPFRSPQKPRRRPVAGSPIPSREPLPPRGLVGGSVRGLGRSPGTAAGRPPGSPQAPAAGRSSSPFHPAGSFRSDPGRGGPPRGGRPNSRPSSGSKSGRGTPRNGRPPGAGRDPVRGREYDRPRPAGKTRFDANAASGCENKNPQAPFAAKSRSSKSWPRAASLPLKPGGKASRPPAAYRGRKPARKKPGA